MASKSTSKGKLRHRKKSNSSSASNSNNVHKNNTAQRSYPTHTNSIEDYDTPSTSMSTGYPYPYPYPYYSYPTAVPEWNPVVPVKRLYRMAIPVVVRPAPMLSTPISPYMPPGVIPPHHAVMSRLPNYTPPLNYLESAMSELDLSGGSFYGSDYAKSEEAVDPIEYYLSLPKDLFPSVRMMPIDPNDLIGEFCTVSNLCQHVTWILDLEFGIFKSPIPRPIPFYNVKYNSICCMSMPDAIHPIFGACNESFKRAFLYYFSRIVTAWYRGYVFMNGDNSLENYQAWLSLPMQELGLCWR